MIKLLETNLFREIKDFCIDWNNRFITPTNFLRLGSDVWIWSPISIYIYIYIYIDVAVSFSLFCFQALQNLRCVLFTNAQRKYLLSCFFDFFFNGSEHSKSVLTSYGTALGLEKLFSVYLKYFLVRTDIHSYFCTCG